MGEDLEHFFSDEGAGDDAHGDFFALPPQPPASRSEMRRKRERIRRRRMITAVAALVVAVLVVVIGVVGMGKLKAWRDARGTDTAAAVQDYSGPGDEDVTFTVSSGQGAGEVGENLVKADIVKSAAAFTNAVASVDATLYPGTFALKTHMKASDVVTILSDQSKAGGFLEVRPGERLSDVIANAAAVDGFDADAFKSLLEGDGSGILPAEAGGSFEGWLEPGAYNVQNREAADVVKDMVDARIAKLDKLGVPTGSERDDILKIASIAEAEVNSEEYYAKVTRVIDNRIEQGMTLGMDTTVAYGLGIKASELTDAQLSDESNPYNTRVHKGLTPTPISNPGDSAIKAALSPEEGDWLFFVTVDLSTGETKFTTGTLDEQNAQFQQYVNEYKTNNENAN
ncbi:endolytic transglycosylase MltG [Bifidobacterium amazonense]|uniref:Endolytic murein transglycosylase n=1 Tax=Bifidobacterium amazonense TaxID=2809027 RepID=A0ABS9VT23_9BIFI|nr:endolytic transglycosylase MltG [Bifidobacterium amazonense]MCH9275249.1 endolytic transglycosylase MltG [Bifidobacterium amazonense]